MLVGVRKHSRKKYYRIMIGVLHLLVAVAVASAPAGPPGERDLCSETAQLPPVTMTRAAQLATEFQPEVIRQLFDEFERAWYLGDPRQDLLL